MYFRYSSSINNSLSFLNSVSTTLSQSHSSSIFSFKVKITELSHFKTFKEAISEVGIKKVLPSAKSLVDGIKMYEAFPHKEYGNYKDAAKKYGVLRMKFELL